MRNDRMKRTISLDKLMQFLIYLKIVHYDDHNLYDLGGYLIRMSE